MNAPEINGFNTVAWVEGNTPNRVDPLGLQAEIGAACAAFILGDGPFPFGDTVCLFSLAIAGILAGVGVGYAASQIDPEIVARQLSGRYYSPPGQIIVTAEGKVVIPRATEAPPREAEQPVLRPAPVAPNPNRPPNDPLKWVRRLLDLVTTLEGLRRVLDLLACPQQQPNGTPTPTPTPRLCDPDTFENWWNSRRLAGGVYSQRWYQYEQKVSREAQGTIPGIRPRNIPAGSETIAADGALKATCQLIDAKFGPPAPWVDLPDEIRRYRLAVTIPNGTDGAQPSGLIIRTTSEDLRSLFEDAMRGEGFTINVDGFVEICTVDAQGGVTCR